MYCTKEQFKDDLYHYLSGYFPGDESMPEDAAYIDPNAEKIISSFESVDYDVDIYVKNRVYESFGDDDLAYDLFSSLLLIHNPPIEPILIDILNGKIEITASRIYDNEWLPKQYRKVHNENLRTIYLTCDSDLALWKYMSYHGVGNLDALHTLYQGKSPDPEGDEITGIPCYYEFDAERLRHFEEFFDARPKPKPEPNNKVIEFSIEGDEVDRYKAFREAHLHKDTVGKIGDSFEVIFYETGIGCISKVKCLECGEEEILTDLDNL